MTKNYLIDLDTIYENLQKESVMFLTEMIEKANRNIKMYEIKDSENRTSGMSYKEREENINLISAGKELIDEYRAFVKKGVRPLKEWFDDGDLTSLEDNGYKWYVKTYFRRIFYRNK